MYVSRKACLTQPKPPITEASDEDMEKNDKKLDLVKKLGLEKSKKKILEKQLEMSSRVLKKVSEEIDGVFKELGIDINEESDSGGNCCLFIEKSTLLVSEGF